MRERIFSRQTCIVGIAAVLALTGCATVNTESRENPAPPVTSLLEIRNANVVIQQWDLSCGAAALATILAYQHGDAVPEKQIAEAMLRRTDPLKVQVKGGFSLLDLKRFAESRGFKGTGYLNLSLKNLIELGPTIIPVNLGDYNHFVVFRGVAGDKVLLADPAFGNRTIDIKTFEQSWLQNIGFVVSRRDGKTPPNKLTVQRSDFVQVSPDTIRQALR